MTLDLFNTTTEVTYAWSEDYWSVQFLIIIPNILDALLTIVECEEFIIEDNVQLPHG